MKQKKSLPSCLPTSQLRLYRTLSIDQSNENQRIMAEVLREQRVTLQNQHEAGELDTRHYHAIGRLIDHYVLLNGHLSLAEFTRGLHDKVNAYDEENASSLRP